MRFILTGTRVYGPASEDSDLDIVMFKEDHTELEFWLTEHNIEIVRSELQKKEEYSGYYFFLRDMKVNIIHVEEEETMEAWEYATNYMKTIPPIEDRKERVRVFSAKRDEFYDKYRTTPPPFVAPPPPTK